MMTVEQLLVGKTIERFDAAKGVFIFTDGSSATFFNDLGALSLRFESTEPSKRFHMYSMNVKSQFDRHSSLLATCDTLDECRQLLLDGDGPEDEVLMESMISGMWIASCKDQGENLKFLICEEKS